MERYFPSLETLEWSGTSPSEKYGLLAGLPDSLTALRHNYFSWSSQDKALMSLLPRSLLIWDVRLFSSVDDHQFLLKAAIPRIWTDPPPNLRQISVCSLPHYLDFSFLPRTLERCRTIPNNGASFPLSSMPLYLPNL